MKPFQLILLAVFGLLAIGGLVLFSTYKSAPGSGAAVGAVIIWGTLPQAAMQAELDALATKDQAYSKITYVQKQEGNFDSNLSDAIAAGSGPDMILTSQEHLDTNKNKLNIIPFTSLSERTYLDTFVHSSEIYLTPTGTYGIPFAVDPLVMYYNRTLLAAAGVATPPTTWETVTGLAQQVTQQAAGQLTESVIPFGAYENVESARAIVSLLILQSGNPIVSMTAHGASSQLAVSNPGTIVGGLTPAASAMNFYTQFADPAKTIYTWNGSLPSARQLFTSGALLFYPGFASERPILSATSPNLNFDMAAMPHPQTSAARMTYGLTYAFSIPKASKNSSGAFLVASALVDPSNAPNALTAIGIAPANRTSITVSGTDKYAAVYYPQALISTGWLSPAPSTTDQIFGTMIRSITSGRAAVSQALETASQAINSSL
jgi:multiple sugar transport system substrate-binding protein